MPVATLPPSVYTPYYSPATVASAPSQAAFPLQEQGNPIPTEKILNTFLDLVKIPSPTGKEEQVRLYIENRLQQLGIPQTNALNNNQAGYVIDPIGSLVIHLPSNVGSNKTLLLNTHMDVVPPCLNVRPIIKQDPSIPGENRVVYSSGDTVLGGDDKSAIAPLLEALEYSLKSNQPRPNLRITITAQEETGATGASKMDPDLYAPKIGKPDLAISFDINGEQGTVVYQAPQLTLWESTVNGKSAHAGIEPEKGVSALKAAALAAAQITPGRIDPDTTVNIGQFNSGKKFNIVPDQAVVSGEVRSFQPQRVDEELSKIKNAFATSTQSMPGSSFQIQYNTLFKPYKTDLALPILTPLKQAMQTTGLPLLPIRTNGGSDVNVFAQAGIPSVVLSGAYNNPHQISEFVRVKDMATQAQLMLNIWQAYATAR